jgi:hypothetical protein
VAVNNSIKAGPLVFLLQMFVITENTMKRPVFCLILVYLLIYLYIYFVVVFDLLLIHVLSYVFYYYYFY